MIIISDYWLEHNAESGLFIVRGREEVLCPICYQKMKIIGSRQRGVIDYYGNKRPLIIRRCQCDTCNKIHHELPDIIVPYKRYTADAIEKILTGNTLLEDHDCEESTLIRLKSWFFLLKNHFQKTLESLKTLYSYDPQICQTIGKITPLQNHARFSDGWLKVLVRILVNSNRWVQTRSA